MLHSENLASKKRFTIFKNNLNFEVAVFGGKFGTEDSLKPYIQLEVHIKWPISFYK
jgi:hypothetical protein